MLRVGIDVGGTFTDFVLFDPERGTTRYFKTPSTPDDPSEAIAGGLAALLAENGYGADQVAFLGHGTTVATNMILERKASQRLLRCPRLV
jgi:N-methylhydantoinase A